MNRPEKISELALMFSYISTGLHEKYPESIKPLKEACENGEWELVAEAAKLMDATSIKSQFRHAASFGAACIFTNYADYGFEQPPTKKEILAHLENGQPEIFETIPKSKRGLTNWWKEVDCQIEQQREW